MDSSIQRRFDVGVKARLTWDPVMGGRRGLVCFEDDKAVDLGEDFGKRHFQEIANRMVSGRYYPPDAVVFYGRFQEEGRLMEAGDRVLQRAPVFGPFVAWSMVELYVVERDAENCRIGYVTTAKHHGRGIWTAELSWREGLLSLRVKSTACPQSWLFWLGLPVARYLQLRARRRAIEEFRKLCGVR